MRRTFCLGLGLILAAASPAQAAPHEVTINAGQIFSTIDPAKISDYTDYMASANLYDGLANVDPNGALTPELAEKWEVSPDATSVTFHIRPDAKFQDGSPVHAEDVVYSVERLLRINQGPANLFAGVLKPGSVEAIDATTVKFNLLQTFSPFLATVPAVRIVNSKVVKANAGNDDGQTYLATHVAGAGPYTLKSWDRGTGMTIERDPNYYGGWGEGPIDEVRFVITSDEATVRSMAASGELTMSSQYQSPDTYDALAKMPRFKIVKGVTAIAFYLKLNSKVAPTDDVHIRKAIALATDYDTIKGTILPGGDLTGPLPKTFAEAHLDSPQPKFDLDAAKAEIAKSGYAGTTDIPLSLGYVSSAKFEEEIALLMQSNLQQVGFKVTLSGEPWNRITEIASKVETTPNVTEVFFGPTYPSPDSMFYTQYHSKAAGTWASMEWVKSPEIDKMIDDARATGDPAQQAKIYKALQQKLIDDQSDAFVETQLVRHAMDKCLDGYAPVPMQSFDYAFHKYKWTCD
ncbi:MAG: ABC transporter substrate-binding protein [Hyphomicrobiales bacterium]|nr:ABC transporter substrate-binding protein [Hyphomicrobiales bacterium]